MSVPAEVLRQVPGCESGRPPAHVARLPGGAGRNEVLRIDTAAGRFVWRRRLGAPDRPGSRASTELLAHRVAAAAGLAPALLAAAPDGHWLLMEHVEAPWSDAQLLDAAGLERLASRLVELHRLVPPAALPDADAAAMARGYWLMLERRDAGAAAQLAPLCARIDELTARLDSIDAPRVLVHGDLMAANVLGPLPVLVDWEYAQRADPSWDCACLLAYYPALEARLPELMHALQLGSDAAARLAWQRERFALLDRLWRAAWNA